jgi:TP901 family phage tail tape measure protein
LPSLAEAIALTSAVTKGYNDTSAEAVQHTADLAIQTVALGQTTLPELAGAMGIVTPLAGNLGVGMEDLFAVMATGSGVTGSASSVATQFRGILQSLMVPTADMTKLTKKMGYENAQAMLAGEGLQKTIQAIVGASQATGKPLQSFIGSIEGQTLALALAGPQADSFTKNLAAMGTAAGAADAAFLAQTSGINKVGFTMDQLQRYAEVLAQKIGDALAPAMATLLDKVTPLADELVKLVDGFVKMDPATQNWVIGAFALLAALGPLLMILPGIATALGAVGAIIGAITWPVALAVAAVALLGAAWATNFGDIQGKTEAAWKIMQPILATMATQLAAITTEIAKWVAWAAPQAVTLILNIPAATQASVDAWWISWKAKADILVASWKPIVQFAVDWAPSVLGALQTTLLARFAPILLFASWQSQTLTDLWNSLSDQFKEPVMVWASWANNVLSDLWDAVQSWFTAKPINVLFNASAATGPGANTILPPDAGAPTVNPYATPKDWWLPGKAMGGPVSSGVPYIVGERGAELFIPNRSGSIIPNDIAGDWASGATGGATINNYNTIYNQVDVNELAWTVSQQLRRRA